MRQNLLNFQSKKKRSKSTALTLPRTKLLANPGQSQYVPCIFLNFEICLLKCLVFSWRSKALPSIYLKTIFENKQKYLKTKMLGNYRANVR